MSNFLQQVCQALKTAKNAQDELNLLDAGLAQLGVGQYLQTATSAGRFILDSVDGPDCDPAEPGKPVRISGKTSALGPEIEVALAFAIDETNFVFYTTISPMVNNEAFNLNFVGGVDMSTYLPAPFNVLSTLGVELVSFGYIYSGDGGDPVGLESIRVRLVSNLSWEIVPGILSLNPKALDVTVPLQYPAGINGSLEGVAGLFDGELELIAEYPSWNVTGKLIKPVSLDSIFLKLFGIDASGGPSGGKIDVLEFSSQPRDQSYSVKFNLSGNQWKLPVLPTGTELNLDNVGFSLGDVGGKLVEAKGTATVKIGQSNPVELALGVELVTQSVDSVTTQGWKLTGKLAKSQGLLEILQQFLPASWNIASALPPSLAKLDVEKLEADFNTLDMSFTFQAGLKWDLNGVLPFDPVVLAGFELESTLKDNERSYKGQVTGDLTVGSLYLGVIYAFAKGNATITFAMQFKGLQIQAAYNPKNKTVTVSLGGLSFGDMLAWMVNLADPSIDFQLDAPWDALNDLNLKNLSLTINLDKRTVGVSYKGEFNLAIVNIEEIGLVYKKTKSGSWSVDIQIGGRFLDKVYDYATNPLTWDVLNESPPAVPGTGSQFLDLQYLGFGQRIALSNSANLKTIKEVMDQLMAAAKPSETPQLGLPQGIEFNASSQWLIGTQANFMGTLSLSVIFNDPVLYGLRIALAGEKAKSLAGLDFEIMYRKVTDTIGVYHIALTIPSAFRQLQFGQVSVTLPVITIDIYTNGNFRVDVGFPKGLDFSQSFSVQVFPFVGFGGFYFALLNGATSEKVPQIATSVGTFNPVIEFGIGLSLGVGKTIEQGPLKAGLTLTAVGILEGVIGWFNPTTDSAKSAEYFMIQGTAALVGKLYGEIDFVIISARIEVTAFASVTLTIESYEPILIELDVAVSAKVTVKVLFIKVHLSFSMTLHAQFDIGHKSLPPWGQATIGRSQILARSHKLYRLRAQRPLRRPRAFYAVRNDGSDILAVRAPDWTPPNLGSIRPLNVSLLPSFTVGAGDFLLSPGGETANPVGPTGPRVEAALQLFIENSIDPAAHEAFEVKSVADMAQAASKDFNALAEGILYWVINAIKGSFDGEVTEQELQAANKVLADPIATQKAFSQNNVYTFLGENYFLNLKGPTGSVSSLLDAMPEQSGTVFPMIPLMSYAKPGGTAVDFSTRTTVDAEYLAKVKAYFAQLKPSAHENVASGATGPVGFAAPLSATGPTASMATQVFNDYFALVAKSAVQNSISLLDSFVYQIPGITGPVGSSATDACQRTGPAGIADLVGGMKPVGLGGFSTTPPTLTGLASEFGVPAEAILEANQNRSVLTPGVQLPLEDIFYQAKAGDTLSGIAARFSPTGATMSPQSLVANADNARQPLLSSGSPMWLGGIQFPVETGDTAELIAAILEIRNGAPPGPTGTASALMKQGLMCVNPTVSIDGPTGLPAGLALKVPLIGPTAQGATASTTTCAPNQPTVPTDYVTRADDTLDLIAGYFTRLQFGPRPNPLAQWIAANNPGGIVPGMSVKLPSIGHLVGQQETFSSLSDLFFSSPQSLAVANGVGPVFGVTGPTGANSNDPKLLNPLSVFHVPTVNYTVGPTGNTIGSIANDYNLTLDELADSLGSVPGLFAKGATVGIPRAQKLPVDLLSQALLSSGGYNSISAAVSRFLLAGMRLPSPLDTRFQALTEQELRNDNAIVDIWGNADLLGSQFEVVGDTLDLTFNKPSGYPWLVFEGPTGPTANPDVLKLNLSNIQHDFPDTTFTPGPTAGILPYVHPVPSRYPMQHVIHWQSASPPSLGPTGMTGPAAGEPTIWTFSDTFSTNLKNTPQFFNLLQRTTMPGSAYKSSDVPRFNWATMVDFRVQQVPGSGGILPNTYLVQGAGQTDQATLEQAWASLNKGAMSAELYVLYSPDPADPNPSGLASDKVDRSASFLLKTNLSTLTASGQNNIQLVNGLPPSGEFHATLSPAGSADFVRLLWEASIVASGGFYLQYATDSGDGLPGTVFDENGESTLRLLILASSPANEVYPYNNCVLVGDNIDASTTSLFSQSVTGPNAPEHLTPVPAIDPGNIGFVMSRPDPGPTGGTPSDKTQSLYNLFSYQVSAPTGPTGATAMISRQALPAGPVDFDENKTGDVELPEALRSADGRWDWRETVPLAPILDNTELPASSALPSPRQSPYTGITEQLTLGLRFNFQDLYGNRTIPTLGAGQSLDLQVPLGYYDEILPLAMWPGIGSRFNVSKVGGASNPTITADLSINVSEIVPAAGNSLDASKEQAATWALKYRQTYYQVQQPDYCFNLRTSLDVGSEASPYALDKRPLANLATSGYVFSNTAQQLEPTHYAVPQVTPATTLTTVATTLSVAAGSLLEANQTRSTADLFATTQSIQLPIYYLIAHGDSLYSIAAADTAKAIALGMLESNQTLLLTEGIVIATKPRTLAIDSALTNKSFHEIAVIAKGSISGLASANADQAIIAKDVTFRVRGAALKTKTVSSFKDIASQFENEFEFQGVTAAEVATTNSLVPGVLKIGGAVSALAVEDFVASGADSFQSLGAQTSYGTTRKLVAMNVTTENAYTAGSQLLLKVDSQSPGTETLDELLDQLAISAAQLASFNMTIEMKVEVSLVVPGLATLPATAYSCYIARTTLKLADLKAWFGVDPGTVAQLNLEVPGLFDPTVDLTACGKTKAPLGPDQTFASLFSYFKNTGGCSTLDDFADQIASTPGLFVEDALLLLPAPTSVGATTFDALSKAANASVVSLAQANAATARFLNAGKQIIVKVAGATHTLDIGQYETFNTLASRMATEYGVIVSIEKIALQNAVRPSLVAAGARFLIPPQPASVVTQIKPDLPSVIFAVSVDIGQHRDLNHVAEGARSNPAVWSAYGAVAPATGASSGGGESTQVLTEFALAFEKALPGLKAASGEPMAQTIGNENARQVWAVDFQADGINVDPVPNGSKFFAIQPLANHLMSRTDVPIDAYEEIQP